MGSQDLSLGDRLAIWTVLPLAILAVCSTVWRHRRQELADRNCISLAFSTSRTASDVQRMKQDLAKLEEQLTRTRVKLKVVRMDLGISIEDLAGGQANQSESYVQMAENMRDTERRLAGCEEVLIKIKTGELPSPVHALVSAMNQLRDEGVVEEPKEWHLGGFHFWLGRRRRVDSLQSTKSSKRSSRKLRKAAVGVGGARLDEGENPPLAATPCFEHPVGKEDTIQEETPDQVSQPPSQDREVAVSEVTGRHKEAQLEEPQVESWRSEDSSCTLPLQEITRSENLYCSAAEQTGLFLDPRDCTGVENSIDLSEDNVKSLKRGRGILQLFRKPNAQETSNDDQQSSPVAPTSNDGNARDTTTLDSEGLPGRQSGDVTVPKGRLKKSFSFPALQWMLKPSKQPQSPKTSPSDEDPLISDRQVSASSAPTGDCENDLSLRLGTRGKGGFPCFWWSQSLQIEDDDDDEVIQQQDMYNDHDLTPPGLVGLQNLGNTCFLNTALQCLRCTPRLAELVVPELENGFRDDLSIQLSLDSEDSFIWKKGLRSFSVPHNLESCNYATVAVPKTNFDELLPSPENGDLGDVRESIKILSIGEHSRSSSLPGALPSHLGSWLYVDDTGLVGGSSTRQTSETRIWKAAKESLQVATASVSVAPSPFSQLENCEAVEESCSATNATFVKVDIELVSDESDVTRSSSQCIRLHLAVDILLEPETCDDIPSANGIIPVVACNKSMDNITVTSVCNALGKDVSAVGTPPQAASETEIHETDRSEIFRGEEFIAAFRKTMLATCMLPAETSFNPKPLFKRLAKLPMGDIYCDGGQHDCQEILEVLLNLLHEQLRYGTPVHSIAVDGALLDVHRDDDMGEALWTQYLERNCSPITDLFAGQHQIVRTCQKCNTRTMTYEPFWELSLPLQKGRTGWFGGRGPSTIEDLLRAFTSGEVLQGDNCPFCETCQQNTPATRRIRIHRFPAVLILHIKRFKHTLQGRQKLTTAISYPLRDLKLQNFGSHEGKMDSASPCSYNLYASSNHFGTLTGGHYTATCKVKDQDKKEAWYCFNDQAVNRVNENEVVSPSAYVLFYVRQRQKPHSQ